MSLTHYRLPLDEEFDKDIIKWINKFSRNKKGEMVRHAVRYYMEQTGEGDSIKFPQQYVQYIPNGSIQPVEPVEEEPIEEEEKEPQYVGLNFGALKKVIEN